jgi:hypothetical protein
MRSTNFFKTDTISVSTRLNEYLKSNFGYEVEGDLDSLREAKANLEAKKREMNADYQNKDYVETMLMLETIKALLKAHLSEGGKHKYVSDAQRKAVHAKKAEETKEPKMKKEETKVEETKVEEKAVETPKEENLEETLLDQLNKLLEGDAAEAEITMAARGIVDELQDVVEKLGKIQNDQLGPLADEMAYTHGPEQAESFKSSVDQAIAGLLDSARSTKDAVNNAALVLSGEAPADDMTPATTEIGGDMEDDMKDDIAADLSVGDEASSGEADEPLGRSKRD